MQTLVLLKEADNANWIGETEILKQPAYQGVPPRIPTPGSIGSIQRHSRPGPAHVKLGARHMPDFPGPIHARPKLAAAHCVRDRLKAVRGRTIVTGKLLLS